MTVHLDNDVIVMAGFLIVAFCSIMLVIKTGTWVFNRLTKK